MIRDTTDAAIIHKYLLAKHFAEFHDLRFIFYEDTFSVVYINYKPIFSTKCLDEMIDFLKNRYDIDW